MASSSGWALGPSAAAEGSMDSAEAFALLERLHLRALELDGDGSSKPFLHLPEELTGKILSSLGPRDLKVVRLVSRDWLRVVSREAAFVRPRVCKIDWLAVMFPGMQSLDLTRARGVNDAQLATLERVPALTSLNLKRCGEVTDGGLAHLARLSGLRSLDLSRCQISDAGLAHLSPHAFPVLQRLSIKWCSKVSDEGVVGLVRLSTLVALNLASCRQLTAAAVEALRRLPRLAELNLNECELGDGALECAAQLPALTSLKARLAASEHTTDASDRGLLALAAHASGLRSLHLALDSGDAGLAAAAGRLAGLRQLRLLRCEAVTDAGVGALARMAGLTALSLHDCEQVTDAGLTTLTALSCLEQLSVSGAEVTDWGLAQLARLPRLSRLALGCARVDGEGLRGLAGLTALDLSYCGGIRDESLGHLRGLTQLRELNLAGCDPLTDPGLASLAGLHALTRLNLSDCSRVSGRGLAALSGLRGLADLGLSFCGVDDAGLAAAVAALPGLTALNLCMCKGVTDAGIKALARAGPTQLVSLNIVDCSIANRATLRALRMRLPGLAVERRRASPPLLQVLTKRTASPSPWAATDV